MPGVLVPAPGQTLTETLLVSGKVVAPKGGVVLAAPLEGGDDGGVRIGVPWSEDEFLRLALVAKHPFDAPPVVPDDVARAIFAAVTTSPRSRREEVHRELARWRARDAELRPAEAGCTRPWIRGEGRCSKASAYSSCATC